MIAAVIVAVIVMMFLSGPISDFVDRHPTIKMLALSFLILIGVALVGEGLGLAIPKGYIYLWPAPSRSASKPSTSRCASARKACQAARLDEGGLHPA